MMNPNSNEACPFEFNFDPATFKVGDTVSYRVKSLAGFPFVGTLKAVHADSVELVDQGEPDRTMKASRESRPVVDE